MLTKVAIAGADDKVKPEDLFALSVEFPFVEWGILLSQGRAGGTRYPRFKWISDFLAALPDRPSVQPAVHLCGSVARMWMRGQVIVPTSIGAELQTGRLRIQINGFDSSVVGENVLALRDLVSKYGSEHILQVRAEDQINDAAATARVLGHGTSLLWDPSGGRGVAAPVWPTPPTGLRMGYAGGIKPENVVEVIAAIDASVGATTPYWIDMESGVRDTNDRFDLGRVRAVLEAAAPFVSHAADP